MVSWKKVLAFILWLILNGCSREAAILSAQEKFGLDYDEIESRLE